MTRRLLALVCAAAWVCPAAKKPKADAVSPLDAWVAEANARARAADQRPPGSIWQPGGVLTDLARDLRASQVDDLVTIVVEESASAVSKGSTKTSRQSAAKAGANSAFGITRATGPLANMLDVSGNQSLAGEGTTVRENSLVTTVSARVAAVMPNGYLVLEGTKNVVVNSEVQLVTVRGAARPADISPSNTVRSDRLAQLEVRINGKGVVGDAIRRPHFLYRLLLGILPF
ncbi:MAG TPA: flagellar basal body L-ring protein FlgH [Bryobacteraceae bacterium]|nr:flagellar basal body L-ring protein FlgH [Bryobacteraceae bacterium]